jgi:hypothetical protein
MLDVVPTCVGPLEGGRSDPTSVSSRAIVSCLEVAYLLREIIRLRRLIAPPKGLAIPS